MFDHPLPVAFSISVNLTNQVFNKLADLINPFVIDHVVNEFSIPFRGYNSGLA